MTTAVRFYDAFVVKTIGSFDYYNDSFTSDGTPGKGRFVVTVDPFTAPSGTDGQFDEFDFVVDDPADPTKVFWGFLGVNVAASPALVTGGFTFDSDTPTIFDYWGVSHSTKTNYDTYVAGNLVAGATNYARNNATFYDGTYTIQGLGFVVPVDGASATNWWADAPILPHATPTFTAPATGAIFDTRYVSTLPFAFSDSVAFDHYQVRLLDGTTVVYDSGDVSSLLGTSVSASAPISYPHTATTIEVRVYAAGSTTWSAWATRSVFVLAQIDTPVSCFEAEAISDSPSLLWLFRETAPASSVADLTGNGFDGLYENNWWLEQNDDQHVDNSSVSTTIFHTVGDTYNVFFSTPPPAGRLCFMVFSYEETTPVTIDWRDWTHLDSHIVGSIHSHLLTRLETPGSTSGFIQITAGTIHQWAFVAEATWAATLDAWTANTIAGPATTLSNTGPVTWTDHGVRRKISLIGVDGDWGSGATGYAGHTQIPGALGAFAFIDDNFPGIITPNFTATGSVAGSNATVWTILLKPDPVAASPDGGWTSGICDAHCVDANAAARFWPGTSGFFNPGHIRNDESQRPLAGATDFTIEMIGRTDAAPGTGGELWFGLQTVDTDKSADSIDLYVRLQNDSPSPLARVDASDIGPGRGKHDGCDQHIAYVYTAAPIEAADQQRLYVNGLLVARSAGAPGGLAALANGWAIAYSGVGGEPPVFLSAAALYPSALPINRVLAHASHTCRCLTGQGFVLGFATFN